MLILKGDRMEGVVKRIQTCLLNLCLKPLAHIFLFRILDRVKWKLLILVLGRDAAIRQRNRQNNASLHRCRLRERQQSSY